MSKIFFSEFSTDILIPVGVISGDDSRYQTLKPLFERYGYGFTDISIGGVFIDGEAGLTPSEYKWVEAHEVAHILSGSEDEKETDLLAHTMLIDKGYVESAEVLMRNLERHEI